jgi:RNA polymerase sigma factor (sigma-70 family)
MEALHNRLTRDEGAADELLAQSLTAFVRETEPRLRRALVAALGVDAGSEATSEALAYGWEHWRRLRGAGNPAGYLYRVGKRYGVRRSRRSNRHHPVLPRPPEWHEPWIEPKLPAALERLSEQQRVTILLTRCLEWTYAETAEMLGVSVGTVERHVERGLRKLRSVLGGGET